MEEYTKHVGRVGAGTFLACTTTMFLLASAKAAPNNNWQGGTENTEVPRTANWSQGYVPTDNMRFQA